MKISIIPDHYRVIYSQSYRLMVTYKVPVVITGFAVVKFPEGKAVGDYIGGLPRDAEFEVCNESPFLCGARMENCKINLAGETAREDRSIH